MNPSLTCDEHTFNMNFVRPQDVQVSQLDDQYANVKCLLCSKSDILENEVGRHFATQTHIDNLMVVLEVLHGGHPI